MLVYVWQKECNRQDYDGKKASQECLLSVYFSNRAGSTPSLPRIPQNQAPGPPPGRPKSGTQSKGRNGSNQSTPKKDQRQVWYQNRTWDSVARLLTWVLGGVAPRVQSHTNPNYRERLLWRVSYSFHIILLAICVICIYKKALFLHVWATRKKDMNGWRDIWEYICNWISKILNGNPLSLPQKKYQSTLHIHIVKYKTRKDFTTLNLHAESASSDIFLNINQKLNTILICAFDSCEL